MKSALCIALLSLPLSLSVCLPAHAYEVQTGAVMICERTSRPSDSWNCSMETSRLQRVPSTPRRTTPWPARLWNSLTYRAQAGRGQEQVACVPDHPIVVVGIHTAGGSASVAPRVFFTVVEVKEFAV